MNKLYLGIVGVLVIAIIILSLRGPKVIEKPVIDKLEIGKYTDSIKILKAKTDSLYILIDCSTVERIKTVIKYKYVKEKIPYISNDSLDSLIFMEPRGIKMLQ